MKIRLYMDEDAMDQVLVKALRARSIDVLTALDAGMIEREDREHLDYATKQGRGLYARSMWGISIVFIASMWLRVSAMPALF